MICFYIQKEKGCFPHHETLEKEIKSSKEYWTFMLLYSYAWQLERFICDFKERKFGLVDLDEFFLNQR